MDAHVSLQTAERREVSAALGTLEARGRTDRVATPAVHARRAAAAVPRRRAAATLPLLHHSGTVAERRSLTGELYLSCARPAADG